VKSLSLKFRLKVLLLTGAPLLTLGACSDETTADARFSLEVTVAASDNAPETGIEGNLTLTEGDAAGLTLNVSINRTPGFSDPVTLAITGDAPSDIRLITETFSQPVLQTNTEDTSTLVLRLDIDDRPIMPHNRRFRIIASNGLQQATQALSIDIAPTSAPDIYLLAGQSNMVGFSGDGTRQDGPGGFDESVERIKQLNVSKNDRDLFLSSGDFISSNKNVIAPDIVLAKDPLHIPLDASNGSGKELNYIGLGLSFAKRALQDTTVDVVLVPAAWSGSSFCDNGANAPRGNWNALPSANPELGNTWLFDRAVTRTNLAIEKTGGILRGILWHQGESDANDDCAPIYNDNMGLMVQQFRMQIAPDLRGEQARQADSNIPFVLGTMSQGNDARDTGIFPYSLVKQNIDQAHREFPALQSHVALSNHDDLTPENGFACGNDSCIHFGPAALREMGSRYYDALIAATSQ